ncbi:hypothetical protein VTL71DRAFT_8417 [Oculimacula yallundae]|uniref:Uncharacterized protein n=1 Tax=Oculimacula yallundae TaxID=86028 RepID=A0ABR4CXJ7_9HELO
MHSISSTRFLFSRSKSSAVLLLTCYNALMSQFRVRHFAFLKTIGMGYGLQCNGFANRRTSLQNLLAWCSFFSLVWSGPVFALVWSGLAQIPPNFSFL